MLCQTYLPGFSQNSSRGLKPSHALVRSSHSALSHFLSVEKNAKTKVPLLVGSITQSPGLMANISRERTRDRIGNLDWALRNLLTKPMRCQNVVSEQEFGERLIAFVKRAPCFGAHGHPTHGASLARLLGNAPVSENIFGVGENARMIRKQQLHASLLTIVRLSIIYARNPSIASLSVLVMSKSVKKLGLRIKELREERHWTQEECASYLGIHYSTVGHLESGDRNVTMKTLDRIAKGFGITLEELFKGI